MRVPTTTIQNAFGKYLKKVMSGDEIIITKNGNGVAKLIKYEEPMKYVTKEGAGEYYIRRRVSYEEFLEFTENSEQQYELIDGELYMMASPGHKHQVVVMEILYRMRQWFEDKSCIPLTAPYDVKLFNDAEKFEDDPNVVQPDVLVICDPETVDEKDRYQGTPTLVVEVLSPSTRSKDMLKKLSLYSKSGVSEYWVVDMDNNKIMVYYFEEGEIMDLSLYGTGEMVESSYYDGLKVAVDDVMK